MTCGYPTPYNCFQVARVVVVVAPTTCDGATTQVVSDESANCGVGGARDRFVKLDANHRQVVGLARRPTGDDVALADASARRRRGRRRRRE